MCTGDEGDHVQVADDDQGEGRQPHGGDRGDSLQGQQVRPLFLEQEDLSKFNEEKGPKWHSPNGSMPFHRAQKVWISRAPTLLPLALVMDLHASKTLNSGPYKS